MIDSRSKIGGIKPFYIVRKFLIFLLTAFLLPNSVEANWFGKYNSRYEALEACQKWKEKGEKYTDRYRDRFDVKYDELGRIKSATPLYRTVERNSRSCKLEKSTNQYLGFELKSG